MTARKLDREFTTLVRTHPERDHSDWLRARIADATTPEARDTLAFRLVHELQRTGQLSAAETLLRRNISKHPRHPYPVIALAEHFHYSANDLSKAKHFIAKALIKAKAEREFVYHALGVQARLAIESGDWKLLERSLLELSAYRHKTGNADVFPESDFLSRIPPNVVSPTIVDAYVKRRSYLSSIGYGTLTGRSTRTRLRRAG